MPSMGLNQLGVNDLIVHRKFRWILDIPSICSEEFNSTTNALPPLKSARPSVSFKEIEVQHLNETVYFPSKPDWKPLNVTLYSVHKKENAIYKFLKKIYNHRNGSYNLPNDNQYIIPEINLKMLSGNGCVLEQWIYEDCWMQSIDFSDLDMSSNEFCSVDLVFRYNRAYVK